MRIKLFLILLIFFLSCRQKPVGTTPTDTLATDGTLVDTLSKPDTLSVPASLPIKLFKGFYINGNEVNTFRDCAAGEQTYWVEDESGQLASAYKKAKGGLSYPYESVYAEVSGYLKGKSELGYAAEYANVLVVKEVKNITQKSYSTPCFKYEFIALGTEPFWSAEIIPAEKIIAVKDVATEKTYTFPYSKPLATGDKIVYQASNEKKEIFNLTLFRENCNDGMSDRNYAYSAQLTINGKVLSGCAIKKGDKL